MTQQKPQIQPSPVQFRLGRAKGADPVIDKEGGKYGAGIIRGVSLASVGEALGHEMWLDQETIDQITEFAAGKGETGLKCRFTHPDMSSDGMGRHLGRLFDVRTEGEKSVGDLHFQKSAHETPDGDLAEYVMMLTEEDPKAAGLSIVFHHDPDAETEFLEAHSQEKEYEDYRGRKRTRQAFVSPDSRNSQNYRHVRIAELRAADVVDEPAANPDGLFDRSPLAREADHFLSYAVGLSDHKPVSSAFEIDGDRAAQFFTRWAKRHGISFSKKEDGDSMSTVNETPDSQTVTRESLLQEQNRFIEKFGAELGVKWFSEGKSFAESLELFCDQQSEQIGKLQSDLDEQRERFASLSLGEDEPLDTGAPVKDGSGKKRTFAEYTNPSKN